MLENTRLINCLVTIAVTGGLIGMSGCDPNRAIASYYKDLGLTGLAAPRDDTKPGAIILVGSQGAVMMGNVSDFVAVPTSANDITQTFNAVLEKHNATDLIKASAAVSFLKPLLGGSFGLAFSNDVAIAPTSPQGSVVHPPDLEALLNSNAAVGLRQRLQAYMGRHVKVYVAYETYSTNQLNVCSASGTDVTGEINVGQSKDSSGNVTGSTASAGNQTNCQQNTPASKDNEGAGPTKSTKSTRQTSPAVGKGGPATKATNAPAAALNAAAAKGPSGQLSFQMARTQQNQLVISGSKYYVFALRTGQLIADPSSPGKYMIFQTNFLSQLAKDAGGDVKYTSPIGDNMVQLLSGVDLTKFN
jgi:hypothetical protein